MTTSSVWYPYAQMKNMPPPLEVDSANGSVLNLKDGRKLIDAISSWWCVIHGYNHPELNDAVSEQLGKMAHVMLGGLCHQPVTALADKLVSITPEGLKHVFFSDSGSVGMEVSLKIAIQYWRNLGKTDKHTFLALKKAYHGDTCGVMGIGDPDDGMHAIFSGILPKQRFLPAPSMGYEADEVQLQVDVAALEKELAENHQNLAAFVLEPLIQAAGGFNFYSPAYLKAARELCDKYEVLLIFDEVATGFGRTGSLFAAEQAGVSPDVMVLGKGLSTGYLGLAATLASSEVFESFYGPDASNALMHGPTFMGNPLACAVALRSIEVFEGENYLDKINAIEAQLKQELLGISSKRIKDIRVLGAVGVIEVDSPDAHKGIQGFAAERGVWLRPFERYVYTMPPYIISSEQLSKVTSVMAEWFQEINGQDKEESTWSCRYSFTLSYHRLPN